MKKLEDAIKNNKPFYCVGYNLPSIDLGRRDFNIPLYFADVVFHGKASFTGTKFNGKVCFQNTRFSTVLTSMK